MNPQALSTLHAHLLDALASAPEETRRLFHGRGRCWPGLEQLTVDWLQGVLMVSLFREPEPAQLAALKDMLGELVQSAAWQGSGAHTLLLQHRYLPLSPAEWLLGEAIDEWTLAEGGLQYRVDLGKKQNNGLFLDMRHGRDWVRANAEGKRVLNLFAYTCGVGLSAAAGGASEVCNLDFAEGNLAVGRENGLLNPQLAPMQFIQSDYFPAIRQLAGLPIASRRGQKLPSYARLDQRQFDLVLLDPPAWAKSAFGTVDLLRDYQSLLKPALLTTAEDGVLICCNNLAKVNMDEWRDQVLRCASKIGRPVRDCQTLAPGADFPSMDQQPPLKTLILQL